MKYNAVHHKNNHKLMQSKINVNCMFVFQDVVINTNQQNSNIQMVSN